ncbi:MAG TPA: hypothetical protein VET23_14270, partial [Chitinophagaceae bacterium]|nr:hypothetical protein [Chitinophagaceae bacterium]
MKKKRDSGICKRGHFLLFGCVISVNTLFAQQTQITDYVIFGGKTASGQTAPVSPGYSAQIGSSCNIQGGITGSYNLVKSTGNLSISGNIYSGGIIQLANSNIVTGRLSAASSSGKVISVGSSANIGGNIDANGNIVVGGGNVTGTVTHPSGTTYTGPVPGGGNIIGIPNLPILPNMPIINVFAAASSTNISNTQTITPGSYGNVTLGGNKTLTLSGTGIYVFNSIKNSGTANNFVFDFKNDPTGQIKIYVWGDVDLNKVKTSILNGGNETRIYLETHGSGSTSSNGTVAFNIANGSAGQASKWVGSVWAPYAAINIGSGTGSTNLTGALWSGTQVNLQSGISMIFAPFIFCTPPTANAGANQSTCSNIGTASITGASATNQTGVSWSTSGTGTFTNGNTLTPTYTPSATDISAG